MSMPVCRFRFDDSPVFDGFAHGSTWNGFDNVAVTKETLDAIAAWFDGQSLGGPDDNGDVFRAIEPMQENGLYSLSFGFATQIVRCLPDFPDYPLADLPDAPPGFIDSSWHNDTCPSYTNEANGMTVWCDYADTTRREFQNVPRFTVTGMNPDGTDGRELLSTDEWSSVLDYITKEGN